MPALQQSSSSSGAHPSNKRSVAAISTDEPDDNYLLSILCFNCGLYGHYANTCPQPFNYEQRSKHARGGGKGGKGKGGGRGGRSSGRFNGYGRGGKGGNSDSFRSAITQLVNAIQNDAPPDNYAPPAVIPPTPPTATERAMDHLLNQFFNCAIRGYAKLIVAAIHKRQSLYPPGTVFWLFDTACGSHLAMLLKVYGSGPRVPTQSMFVATGAPMPATFEASTKCGFDNVKYCHLPVLYFFKDACCCSRHGDNL